MDLTDFLVKNNWLKSQDIIDAFRKIKRVDFLPEDQVGFADLNEPLSIGHNQTISQPLTVAFMLELLKPKKGEKILDIGAGSGWTTALLSYIVGSKGKVIAIEIIPELSRFGKKNVSKYSFIKKGIAKFICKNGSEGYKKEAPFDKILCSAALEKNIPKKWKEQLKIGGKIVVPIKSSIWLFEKKSEKEFKETKFSGFLFVPFLKK